MKDRIGKVSLLLLLLVIAGGIVSAATVNVDGFGLPRLLIFCGALVGSGGLFYAHVRLVRKSDDEKAYLGVVLLTYAFLALTVVFLSLLILVLLGVLGIEIGEEAETRILYGFIGSSSLATLAAALVFVVGERYGYLFLRVDAWPLTALRRMARRAEAEITNEDRDALLVKFLATIPGAIGGAAIVSILYGGWLVWAAYGTWLVIGLVLAVVFWPGRS